MGEDRALLGWVGSIRHGQLQMLDVHNFFRGIRYTVSCVLGVALQVGLLDNPLPPLPGWK